MKKTFLGLFACAALCACSNDVQDENRGDGQQIFTGDVAYMNVRLADAGSVTRAAWNDKFEYGENEQAVKSAHFYFYDGAGVFVTEASVWNGGTPSTASPAENIEFRGNSVIALKGLTGKNYPKYLVTVLNKQANFTPGSTLDEMESKLSDETTEGIVTAVNVDDNTMNYFTMSTSSFAGQKDAEGNDMKYFVTELKDENFQLEPIPATIANPVVVYVERLAAKVSLKVASTLTKDDNGRYKITATVSGEDNAQNAGNIGAENLYIEFLGWKLNATAKKSYIMKNIDENWENTAAGLGADWTWNDAANHRSYWGKSFNYGLTASYPTGSSAAAASPYLDYVTLDGDLNAVGDAAYCAENTNTSTVVSGNFPSAVTSILLKAKVYDEDGVAGTLVRFNGVLYKENAFLKYIINVLKMNGLLDVYYEDGNDGTGKVKFTQIGAEYVKLENVGDGEVKVVFNNENGTELYAKGGKTDIDKETDKITDFTALNENLASASADAIGYKDGEMYYNIPIEHFNETEAGETIPEAKYGIVRNHSYVVTIDKLEKVGKGIFNPEEVIVPDPQDSETYYVGARINILSWKIVEQGVEL